ncbi:hypothetical protein MMC34_001836 [Xylographa carneopallida]|nr:hypothetical protein [Xylographa carneopallida]
MLLDIGAPDTSKLNNHFILKEIIDHVQELGDDFPNINLEELITQLTQVNSKKCDPEVQLRGFLKVFQDTPMYRKEYSELESTTQGQLHEFINGGSAADVVKERGFALQPSPAAKHHFKFLDSLKALFAKTDNIESLETSLKAAKVPLIYENDARSELMEVYSNVPFVNWGQSVHNVPSITVVPTKVKGIQNLVFYAKEQNLRIRCSGYRHSWSPLFSEDGQILVSLLNLKQVTEIPDPTSLEPTPVSEKNNELKTIELAPSSLQGLPEKRLVRVGVSVTNEEFRRWAVANNSWSLPMDVILVEVTIGGVNGPICHGAGRRHKTMSDLVRMIEYVDANGVHQQLSDPQLLKAAAGCFGLLGIVTHVTLELDAMSYAVLKPRKPDVSLAIPPLSLNDIPVALQKNFTNQQYKDALTDFEDRASNHYYSEWFWFTYQRTAWVNTWNNSKESTGVVDYPSPGGVWMQWIEGWIGGIISSTEFFQALPGHWQAQLLATLGMAVLPPTVFENPDPEIITYIPDALHFRRGIQNTRVRDMEFQIPLPAKAGTTNVPDFDPVRRAWWDVINLVYADPSCPMRLTLELRIMGGSDTLMAPQRGNNLGTASIEVLTVPDAVTDGEWQSFCQKVYEKWAGCPGAGDGVGANSRVRPHWAKEWVGLRMGGADAKVFLRDVAYKEEIRMFKDVLAEIGQKQGWVLRDLKERFSNETWDTIVFG